MEKEQDDLNRPITMEDVVTPISKKPIDQVTADQWPDMDVNELWEQRIFLQTRMFSLSGASGQPTMIAQMQNGLNTLDALIQQKTPALNASSAGAGLL